MDGTLGRLLTFVFKRQIASRLKNWGCPRYSPYSKTDSPMSLFCLYTCSTHLLTGYPRQRQSSPAAISGMLNKKGAMIQFKIFIKNLRISASAGSVHGPSAQRSPLNTSGSIWGRQSQGWGGKRPFFITRILFSFFHSVSLPSRFKVEPNTL